MSDLSMYGPGVKRRVAMGRKIAAERKRQYKLAKKLKFDTIAVHGLYSMQEALENNQGAVIEPVYLSASQAYRDSDEMEAALAYLIPTWCYTRIANPTTYYLEWTLALLEGYGCDVETSCVCTASGMSAIMSAVDPFLVKQKKGAETINFVSTCQVYGGTFQQFQIRKMQERGIEVRWIVNPHDTDEWARRIDKNTRFLYGELPSNPGQAFFDVAAVADLAHSHGIPLICDTTVATPALLRPIEHGADIAIHSATKTLTASGYGVSGALISRKNICTKVENEHPLFKEDFASYVKFLPYRDNGPAIAPLNAAFTMAEIKTLRTKVDLFSRNTMTVARFLEEHPNVSQVDYLGLESHPLYGLASRYLKLVDSDDGRGREINRYGHLMSFHVKGTRKDTRKVFDAFQRIWRATDLGRVKTVATIPAISTHQQQGEEARRMAGIPPQLIRLCVGGEHPDDVINDLDQALRSISKRSVHRSAKTGKSAKAGNNKPARAKKKVNRKAKG